MAINNIERLIGLSDNDVQLLKILSNTGAATADEIALKLSRPGDDLTPQMQQLVQRKLVEMHPTRVGGETYQIFMIDPSLRKAFGS